MKKQTNASRRRSGPPQRPNNRASETIIFGIYHHKDNKAVVLAKGVVHPVLDVRSSVSLPIADNSQVKALQYRDRPGVLVLKVLGEQLSLKERIAKVLKESDVPLDFPSTVMAEAEAFKDKPSPKEYKNRTDLTNFALCTIDGETAKDFDDAVFAQKKGTGIEVIIAIADVSYYVKAQSHLDQEALNRATSIYYPGHCIPMLPEKLSNGLCSLKPKVVRLALAVSFELGPKGGLSKPKIREAVIKSAARLTYNQVQNFYDGAAATEAIPTAVTKSLVLLRKAAHILRKSRERRGAIDFDLIESKVALNDMGEPIAIHPEDRLDAHRIIEDLMVATNEIVAEFFERKDVPSLYRVHEPPDPEKLQNFFKTASAFNVLDPKFKVKNTAITEPKVLQKVMASYQTSAYKETLNTLMLRSMMQARYSEQNLMHFGLASAAYSHFTSPIRRYADLIVHRQLRYVLFEKNYRKQIPEPIMAQVAQSISQRETRATDIERKVDRLYAATFMTSHVGEVFEATIVSCTEFGFFVRITEYHVEGLVHIATISRSHVNFQPEKMALIVSGSNQRYMVGDKVSVRLINVNIDRGHIDFELAQKEASPKKSSPPRSSRRRRRAR